MSPYRAGATLERPVGVPPARPRRAVTSARRLALGGGLVLTITSYGCDSNGPRTAISATATATPRATATASATPPATPSASPTPTATAPPSPTPDQRLRALAAAAGVFVGAAFVEGSDEPEFRALLAREFNSTTAPVYWASTEPQRGTYDFTVPDTAVAIAAANGLRVRGHPLVWGRLALPDYVNQITDPDDLRALMAEHIESVVGRYRGRIVQYDVVNEPLTFLGDPGSTGTGLEDYVFLRVLGPGYIREALDLAHAADPEAELFINEFFVERPGPKQDYFYELARGLVVAGAPLHGVGLQGHITPPFGPQYRPTQGEIAAAVRRFADLGLAVEITELDVTLADPATELVQQAHTYADVFAGCLSVPACRGITTWGISDKNTWIRDFFHVEGAPLLFDENYMPKPAYFAARDVLRQVATRSHREAAFQQHQ